MLAVTSVASVIFYDPVSLSVVGGHQEVALAGEALPSQEEITAKALRIYATINPCPVQNVGSLFLPSALRDLMVPERTYKVLGGCLVRG